MSEQEKSSAKAQFETMYDRVVSLKERYENSEFHYEELLQELQQTRIQYDGVWWAVSYELVFYRFDEDSNSWQFSKPPIKLRSDIEIKEPPPYSYYA